MESKYRNYIAPDSIIYNKLHLIYTYVNLLNGYRYCLLSFQVVVCVRVSGMLNTSAIGIYCCDIIFQPREYNLAAPVILPYPITVTCLKLWAAVNHTLIIESYFWWATPKTPEVVETRLPSRYPKCDAVATVTQL